MSQVKPSRFRYFTSGWLFAKLLLFLVPTFLLFSWIGLQILVRHQSAVNSTALIEYVSGQSRAAVAGLARLDIDMQPGLARDILAPLTGDTKIRCAEIIFTQTHRAMIEVPAGLGCARWPAATLLSYPIDSFHALTIGYNPESLRMGEKNLLATAYWTFAGGIILIIMVSAVGFEFIVDRPMRRLLRAIEKSAAEGRPTLAFNSSRDELGTLTRAFNQLQMVQDEDASRLRQTLDALNHVYHTTPSLMFSLDENGRITRMSTFWQETTGYSTAELAGKPLSDFLDERSGLVFHDQIMPLLAHTGRIRDILLRLKCRNSIEMDVLFSAAGLVVPDRTTNLSEDGLFFCAMSDVTLLKKAERQLQHISMTDHLTGLPNRADLSHYMNDLFAGPLQDDERVAVLFVDLDNFKTINDTHGHSAGDRVLVEATRRLQANIRGIDYIARLGGDEFAVICRKLNGTRGPALTASRLINSLSKPIDLGTDGPMARISASIGIALISKSVESPHAALQMADSAMYEAKRQGRNTYATYGDAPVSVANC